VRKSPSYDIHSCRPGRQGSAEIMNRDDGDRLTEPFSESHLFHRTTFHDRAASTVVLAALLLNPLQWR